MPSPYADSTVEEWDGITQQLIANHPLSIEVILEAALAAWHHLWATRIGDAETGFELHQLDPPAQVVGYLFEKLFSKELARRLPDDWVGGTGSQKDVHCLTDASMSIELKSSGQLGYKVYGNRSYGQQIENADAGKKDKSGYYITINFNGRTLTLLRFGWIDATDWQAQSAQTGQMAGLPDVVYKHKLVPIRGAYELDAPVGLLANIGPGKSAALADAGIRTIRDFVTARRDDLPRSTRGNHQAAIDKYRNLL
ncbi:ScaI family restriction endonuclease [Lysobacter soli]|uniref:ScaI family restriction endonuclease n=1 Tax=Lysobacter soli TaxID=453783 RepID=UPI003CF65484